MNSKEVRETKKKLKVGLAVRLTLMALLPVMIMGMVLSGYAQNILRTNMKNEVQNGLKSAAIALDGAYSDIPGEFAENAEGQIVKGDTLISGDYDLIDYLKEYTGVEATLFYGDTRIVTSLKNGSERNIGTKAGEAVIAEVLGNGNDYFDDDIEINGEKYYGYYTTLKASDGSVVGMIFTGKPQIEVESLLSSESFKIALIAIVFVIIAGVVAVIIALSIIKALKHAMLVLGEVAEGDLTGVTDSKIKSRSDEIGEMIGYIDNLKDSLKGVIQSIQSSSKKLAGAAMELDQVATQTHDITDSVGLAIDEIANGAMTQADETEAAAGSIGHMGDMIEQMVESVNQLNENAGNMNKSGKEATVIIGELNASNNKTMSAVGRIEKQTKTTNESAQQIQQAVGLIRAIAEETNLLSLNASIEAARAGEQGRGFAVVAAQIQKLAEQSNNSAQQIENIIAELLVDSEKTVEIMGEVSVIVEEQQEKLYATKSKFDEVSSEIELAMGSIEQIREKTEILDSARGKIVDVISNLSAISEENAASTQETTDSTEELNATVAELAKSAEVLKSMAASLEKEIEVFKI